MRDNERGSDRGHGLREGENSLSRTTYIWGTEHDGCCVCGLGVNRGIVRGGRREIVRTVVVGENALVLLPAVES